MHSSYISDKPGDYITYILKNLKVNGCYEFHYQSLDITRHTKRGPRKP